MKRFRYHLRTLGLALSAFDTGGAAQAGRGVWRFLCRHSKAFVLAARDPGAFANWLGQQGFASSPESDRWLSYYV
jgi:hypothetical protein